MNRPDSNGTYDIISIYDYKTPLGKNTQKTLNELEKKIHVHIQTLDLQGNEQRVKEMGAMGVPVYSFRNRETENHHTVIGYLPLEKLLEFSHTYCGIKEPKSFFFAFN